MWDQQLIVTCVGFSKSFDDVDQLLLLLLSPLVQFGFLRQGRIVKIVRVHVYLVLSLERFCYVFKCTQHC